MKKLTTFEDIFNKLIDDYLGSKVQVNNKKHGLNITTLVTTIDKIYIKPLEKNKKGKWEKNNRKAGSIVIIGKDNYNDSTVVNIPFSLGIDTMNAVFLKNGVSIKTFDFEFTIKKVSSKQKRLA